MRIEALWFTGSVAHSIELLPDDDTDVWFRRRWAALADAGLPSAQRVRSDTNRPHVTLLAARHIAAAADAVLSDDDIVHTLKSSGVDLARRTVAKYREAMNIPSSVQRRREKRAIAKVAAI